MKPTRTCTFPGCERAFYAKNLCSAHYKQQSSGRKLRPVRADTRGLSAEQRFWLKVEKHGTIPAHAPELGPCWVWTASLDKYGYGQFNYGGTMRRAHRVGYELLIGDCPGDLVADHKCHNPKCVNPIHLRLVPNRVNIQNRTSLGSNNKSGYRGVSWSKNAKKWQASVKTMGRRYHLGYFDDKNEAATAARDKRIELFENCDLDKAGAEYQPRVRPRIIPRR